MIITKILLSLVALLHIYFLVLEMFLWTKPLGLKTFSMNPAQAKDRAVLAANQGLYNGFLAAGLIWSVIHPDLNIAKQLAYFFCLCVIMAALYGAYSVSRRIFFIQGIPAIVALICTIIFI